MRDFTVNAIAIEVTDIAKQLCGPPQMPRSLISAEGIIDPFAGRRDLEKRVIRAVTEGAFRDDPLRMLRAVRQAIELGFRIEDTTYHLIRRDAHLLPQVSAERVRDELLRIIAAPASWQQVRLLVSLNLLKYILPEMAATSGVTQSAPHYQDVFDHTRSVMAHLEGIYGLLWPEAGYRLPELLADDATVIAGPDLWDAVTEIIAPYADDLRSHLLLPLAIGRVRRDLLMWAALAHDWGKPAMRTEDEDGRTRFLEHERWGALLAERRAQELKLSSDEVAYLARLVDGHMRPAQLAREYPLNRRAIYRYFRDLGAAGPDCVLLSLADHISIHAPKPDLTYSGRRLRTAQMLMEAYFRKRAECVNPPSLLNGHQVMAEFGLKPGPQIGQLLEELREAQAVGKVATPDEARTWLAQRLADAV
jgi:tRNA nucleotidyltransferase/poly(A) polymerase